MKMIYPMLGLLVVLLISGCVGEERRYVCCDGSVAETEVNERGWCSCNSKHCYDGCDSIDMKIGKYKPSRGSLLGAGSNSECWCIDTINKTTERIW